MYPVCPEYLQVCTALQPVMSLTYPVSPPSAASSLSPYVVLSCSPPPFCSCLRQCPLFLPFAFATIHALPFQRSSRFLPCPLSFTIAFSHCIRSNLCLQLISPHSLRSITARLVSNYSIISGYSQSGYSELITVWIFIFESFEISAYRGAKNSKISPTIILWSQVTIS